MQGWRFDTKGLSSGSVMWNGDALTISIFAFLCLWGSVL
jgi:hypothetical protein